MTAGWRSLLVLTAGLVMIAAIPGLLVSWLEKTGKKPTEPPVTISFQTIDFKGLNGWVSDDFSGFLGAFLRSCRAPEGAADLALWRDRVFGGKGYFLRNGEPAAGFNKDWEDVCAAAASVENNPAAIRNYLQNNFVPVAVSAEGAREGLFTGYYEPQLKGSRQQSDERAVPLLERPADLVSLDLGDFRQDLKGLRLAGRVVGTRLEPFEDRSEIEAGGLGDAARVLAWIADPVDAFFLHIQGSGRVMLDDGSILRVGYAGQNGHPYVAIGKVLVDRGIMALEDVSMQSLRAWLTANPVEAREVMAANPSYIFFRDLEIADPDLGPLGAGGASLTPWRSLAVDRSFHALGLPIWLETTLPAGGGDTRQGAPLQRLMVSQDTGGAIRGPVRGDIFFGWGDEATDLAGRMKNEGRMTLLLPQSVAQRLLGPGIK